MLYLLGKETEIPCNRYQIYKPKENGINICSVQKLELTMHYTVRKYGF